MMISFHDESHVLSGPRIDVVHLECLELNESLKNILKTFRIYYWSEVLNVQVA